MKRKLILVAAVCAVAAIVVPSLTAGAHHQDLTDGDDTRGLFDIRAVYTWGSHTNMGWQINTFRSWGAFQVWDAGFFVVNVDTRGNPRMDYYLMIRSEGDRLRGLLFRDHQDKRDRIIRRIKVWRPSKKSVRFRFPWGSVFVPETRQVIRWNVQSLWSGDACPSVCIDNVPNAGAVVETRIKPLPPTPTPTPTVTPT